MSGTIGFVLTMIAVTAVIAANGGGFGSIGAGIMVAGFDGFPFGAMIGVMTYFLKYPEAPANAGSQAGRTPVRSSH